MLDRILRDAERSPFAGENFEGARAPWDTSMPRPSKCFKPRRLAHLKKERRFAVNEVKHK